METIHQLSTVDTNIFLFLNGLHSEFFDSIMFAVSTKLLWVPLYAAILYALFRKFGKNALWLAVALVLSVVLADQIASGVLKNAVARLRPSHEQSLAGLVHLVRGVRSGLYGFVSSHAANTFAVALFTSLVFRHRCYTVFIFLWAAIVSYSRIYIGVHYPADILGGAIVGLLCACGFYFIVKKCFPKIFNNHQ